MENYKHAPKISISGLLKKIAVILILVYVGFGLLLFVSQNQFIYYPSSQDFNTCQQFSDSEKININGTRAYYKNISEKLIVFYHGNEGSACDRDFLKDCFSNLGYSSIFVEYAGYSNDVRKSSQKALMQDVENINNFIKISGYTELVIAGESLGASLASYHSSIANEDKLLLIAPFYSLKDLARSHYPVYPVSWMLFDKYESHHWLNDIRQVEIIHGNTDTIIPMTESKRLFSEIITENKKYSEISGSNHNDLYDYPETFSALSAFLR